MAWLSEIQLDNLRRAKGYVIGKNVRISDKAEILCEKLVIGDHSRIDAFSFLSGNIIIGHHTHIGAHCTLAGGHNIIIGNFVGLSSYVYIFTHNADYGNLSLSLPTIPEKFKTKTDYGKVHITSHNIIGAHSTIFPNTLLFRFSKFGSYSLIKGMFDESKLYISHGNKIAVAVRDLPNQALIEGAQNVTRNHS